MGNTASGLSLSRPSRIEKISNLKLKTKDVTDMANALFQFMYRDYDVKEVWDMADNPEDYVIALSDLITNQFHVLGYKTERNQVGEIYFMKYDGPQSSEGKTTRGLAPPGRKYKDKDGVEHTSTSKGIEQQRATAKIIAFYFVRLFQILGALLTVVKDINLIEPGSKELNTGRPILNQPQLPRFTYKGGAAPRDLFLGPYEFLRNYMDPFSPSSASEYPAGIFPSSGNDKYYKITPSLFFVYSQPASGDVLTPDSQINLMSKKFLGKLFVLLTKETSRYNGTPIEIFIKSVNPQTVREFKSPEVYTELIDKINAQPSSIKFRLFKDNDKGGYISVVRQPDRTGKMFYAFGDESVTFAESRQLDPNNEKDFPKILEQLVVNSIYKNEPQRMSLYVPVKKTESTSQTVKGELKLSNPVIQDSYEYLKSKPLPHCIARAVQLLDIKSINVLNNPETNICKFMLYDDKIKSMADYKPIKSLAQLYGKVNPADRVKLSQSTTVDPKEFQSSMKVLSAFVGKEAKGIPLGTDELEKEEADDLARAIERLKIAFNDTQTGPLKKLDLISISSPGECKTNPKAKLTDNMARTLQSVSHQLFAYHVNHTIEITKFLKTIFNIAQRPDGTWSVEGPKASILFAGFPILDQLTDQARELLVDYYAGCETLYQGGVKLWASEIPNAEAIAKPANASAPKVATANAKPANASAPKVATANAKPANTSAQPVAP